MSFQEIRDELMTALVAGHETTASQLAWALERLSREPRVTARLTEELDAGDGDEYLTATINEILRLRPVIPNAEPRLTKRPVEIGGFRYPAGVSLLASAQLVHHDPEIYESPFEFRPERFLEQAAGHLHVDPVRRRAPPLPGRQLRRAGDEDRAARGALPLPAVAGRRAPRGHPAARDHVQPGPPGHGRAARPRGVAAAAAPPALAAA